MPPAGGFYIKCLVKVLPSAEPCGAAVLEAPGKDTIQYTIYPLKGHI